MDGMSIGEVGRRTGFEPTAIRYYTPQDHCTLPTELRRRPKRAVGA
jgi:hypothetical protein